MFFPLKPQFRVEFLLPRYHCYHVGFPANRFGFTTSTPRSAPRIPNGSGAQLPDRRARHDGASLVLVPVPGHAAPRGGGKDPGGPGRPCRDVWWGIHPSSFAPCFWGGKTRFNGAINQDVAPILNQEGRIGKSSHESEVLNDRAVVGLPIDRWDTSRTGDRPASAVSKCKQRSRHGFSYHKTGWSLAHVQRDVFPT